MSWNPSPALGGANWSGNAQLATRQQLLSTTSGIYEDLKDFNFSTLSVSTLTVPLWISTSKLYVSDIQGANINISGIVIDASGVFYAPEVSSSVGQFNITLVSSLSMKGIDLGGIDVSFDFGLGQAIGGVVGGLGALVGGGLIAVGTGAGLAIQGAETGIATMIAGRPENFINSNVYETINFTSQLQVSTIGNAYPLYSSIFRTVSSLAADSIPGKEIFTSTFFYPGQICIRSASDPFNLITGDPQINSSTIQSFGQWVPLEGLEPTNIEAYSVSTVNLQATGQTYLENAEIITLSNYSMTTSNLAIGQAASFGYSAGAVFDLGSSGDAAIVGSINNWNFLTQQPINFFGQLGEPGSLTPDATLTLGTGAQSILQISSIIGTGFIQANTGFFSSLTVNELTVISSFSTVYTVVACNVLSTAIVTADLVSTINLQAQAVWPFTFSSILGNPIGKFDITKYDFVQSTTYNQVSSLTQNILNYTLVEQIQDQTSFNLNIAETPMGVNYIASPQNVTQWGSSIMIFNDWQYPGSVTLPTNSTFILANLTGVFDLQTQYSSYIPDYYANIEVVQEWIPGSEYSTFSTFLNLSGPNPPTAPPLGTWRFEIGSNGWIQSITPNPTPFTTVNSNIFTITQDINDTTIAATDRLNLEAGEIFIKGTLNLTNTNVETAQAINSITCNALVSTLTGNTGFFSTLTTDPLSVGGGFQSYHLKQNISFNSNPTTVRPVSYTFSNVSPDFTPQYTFIPSFMGNNYFTSYNASSWNNTNWVNNTAATFAPKIFCGDLQAPLGPYSGYFYVNNAGAGYPLQVYTITSAGSNLLGTINGGTYARISTINGTTWTLNSVPNPSGLGGTFSNVLTVDQNTQYTSVVDNQNLQIQAPTTTLTTGTLGLFADQIRVSSHKYGTLEATGLPSYPIGIENTLYQDNGMVFSQYGVSGVWYSDATNVVYNVTGNVYYDANSWIIQVIPSRFRFPATCAVYGWDVQPAIFGVAGGTGYCWGYNRYITVSPNPGTTGNNWNWIIAFPKNYCTY